MCDIDKVFSSEEFCYGCGLCANVCARDAIKMIADNAGFFYPKINKDNCVNCKQCRSVCPAQNKTNDNFVIRAYLAQYCRSEILKGSTSGGLFSALSEWIIEQDGVVYGAGYGENMRVEVKRAETEQDYLLLRGSKYVQCDMTHIYDKIENDLKNGRKVLFVGTPCMVSAVKTAFFEYLNLYTVDLVCNGVSAPYIWNLFVKQLEKKYKDRLIDYKFRTKIQGYLSREEIASFESGKSVILRGSIDKYNTTIYYKNIATRQSCHSCKFATSSRIGDFTIGDCHVVPDSDSDISVKEGISILLVNTQKADDVISLIGDRIKKQEIDMENAISLRMKKPIEKNERAEEFFENSNKRGLKYALIKNNGWFNWYKAKLICKLKRL